MITTNDPGVYAKVVAQYGEIWTMMRLTLVSADEEGSK